MGSDHHLQHVLARESSLGRHPMFYILELAPKILKSSEMKLRDDVKCMGVE